MSDENTGVDPLGLGLDLSGVDTSRPCLAEGMHVLAVEKVELADNKRQDGKNLVVTFATVNESPDITGEKIIGAGWKVTKYYPMQQSDNAKAPDYKADLARLQDAVEGTAQGTRPPFNPFNYIGKLVISHLRVTKDEVYGDSNEIKKLEYIQPDA